MFIRIKNWWMQWVMKDALIEAIRQDLTACLAENELLHEVIATLSKECIRLHQQHEPWYQTQDEEMSRMEAEERSDEVHVDIEVDNTNEAIEELDDIPF